MDDRQALSSLHCSCFDFQPLSGSLSISRFSFYSASACSFKGLAKIAISRERLWLRRVLRTSFLCYSLTYVGNLWVSSSLNFKLMFQSWMFRFASLFQSRLGCVWLLSEDSARQITSADRFLFRRKILQNSSPGNERKYRQPLKGDCVTTWSQDEIGFNRISVK